MLTWMLNGLNPQLHISSNSVIRITFSAWTTNILNIQKKKTIKVHPVLPVLCLPPLSSTHSSFLSDLLPVDFQWFHLPPSAFFSHPHSSLFFHPLRPLHLLHPYLSKHVTQRSLWWFLYLPSFSQASSSPLHGYRCPPSLARSLLVFLYLCSSASPLGSRIVFSLSDLQQQGASRLVLK